MIFNFNLEQTTYISSMIRQVSDIQNTREQRRALNRLALKFDARVSGVELGSRDVGAVFQMLSDYQFQSRSLLESAEPPLKAEERKHFKYINNLTIDCMELMVKRLEEVHGDGALNAREYEGTAALINE